MVGARSKNDGRMCPQDTVGMYVCGLEKGKQCLSAYECAIGGVTHLRC